ncbi:four helix bundle protein [Candidatus Woesebacteria bacterium]|nr:MAG: four helix bundle protein [Candidatus Woesebacteria bacterium]
MVDGNKKIIHFYDLRVWQEGHRLVLLTYKLVGGLPEKEKFILIPQMLRAAISITSNVAEGFGRRSLKEKTQFYYIAKASLVELQNQYFIARDMKYLSDNEFENVWDQSVVVHKMLNALITSINNK